MWGQWPLPPLPQRGPSPQFSMPQSIESRRRHRTTLRRKDKRCWKKLAPPIFMLILCAIEAQGQHQGHRALQWDQQAEDNPPFYRQGTPAGEATGNDPPSKPKTALNHGPAPPETDPLYLSRAQAVRESPGRDPVVVLNGLGGAGLKFRLRGAKPTRSYCRSWYARWHTAWILPRVLIPPVARCLMEFLTPVYDAEAGTFDSKPGVEVKVDGFGQIISLENLGPSMLPLRNFDYIHGFINFMMTELGYGPGLDLFAAPYDWRYSPDVLKEQVSSMHALRRCLSDLSFV